MSVSTGFGVNYNDLGRISARDVAYWQAVSIVPVRPVMPSYVNPFVAATNAHWRSLCQTFLAAGRYVTWGLTKQVGQTLTSSNWSNYHDGIVAEASYLTSQGILLNDFEIGNELDLAIDGTTVTQSQLYTNLQQLALDVKAVYSGKVSYALSGSYAVWSNAWTGGNGNLDIITVHPYGNININAQTVNFLNVNNILTFSATNFSNWYISEFNLDSSASNLAALSDSATVSNMNTMFGLIKASGVSMALVYQWCGPNYANNNWAAGILIDGGMSPVWPLFFPSQPMCYTPRVNIAVRIPVPTRINVGVRADVANRTLIYS